MQKLRGMSGGLLKLSSIPCPRDLILSSSSIIRFCTTYVTVLSPAVATPDFLLSSLVRSLSRCLMKSIQCVPIDPWDSEDTESEHYHSVMKAEKALAQLENAIKNSGLRLGCAEELLKILEDKYHLVDFSQEGAIHLLTAFTDNSAKWSHNTSAEDVVSRLSCAMPFLLRRYDTNVCQQVRAMEESPSGLRGHHYLQVGPVCSIPEANHRSLSIVPELALSYMLKESAYFPKTREPKRGNLQ